MATPGRKSKLVIAHADQVESWIPAFAGRRMVAFLVIMSFQGGCCVRGEEGPVSERGTPLRQHFVLPPPLRGEDEGWLPCAPASDHRSGRSIWMWRSVHLGGVSQPGVGFLGGRALENAFIPSIGWVLERTSCGRSGIGCEGRRLRGQVAGSRLWVEIAGTCGR